MRICSPHCGIAPESGSGGEVYERELLKDLAGLGVECHIPLAQGKPHDRGVSGWTVHPVWPPKGLRWYIAPFVWPRAIKRVWDANGALGEITFNSRTAVVPLQAADIMAYETFKLVKNLSEGAPRETRKLGARLYQESLQFGVSHYDRDNLAVLVAAFIANGHIEPPDAA